MNRAFKRLTALLLAALMTLTLLPVTAGAESMEGARGSVVWVNPAYSDLFTPEQIRAGAERPDRAGVRGSVPACETIGDAADYLRARMVMREDAISFSLPRSLVMATDAVSNVVYDAAVLTVE